MEQNILLNLRVLSSLQADCENVLGEENVGKYWSVETEVQAYDELEELDNYDWKSKSLTSNNSKENHQRGIHVVGEWSNRKVLCLPEVKGLVSKKILFEGKVQALEDEMGSDDKIEFSFQFEVCARQQD